MILIRTAKFFSGSKIQFINSFVRAESIAEWLECEPEEVNVLESDCDAGRDHDMITVCGSIVGWVETDYV
jgi:hypothetical protein